MQPLNENELDQLLRKWEAPAAPRTLKRRVVPPQKSWWRWLLTGSIRVPVPIALAAVVLVAVWIHYSRPVTTQRAAQPATVSLTDFKPVPQLQPILVSGERK
jgi:hypothetical protein